MAAATLSVEAGVAAQAGMALSGTRLATIIVALRNALLAIAASPVIGFFARMVLGVGALVPIIISLTEAFFDLRSANQSAGISIENARKAAVKFATDRNIQSLEAILRRVTGASNLSNAERNDLLQEIEDKRLLLNLEKQLLEQRLEGITNTDSLGVSAFIAGDAEAAEDAEQGIADLVQQLISLNQARSDLRGFDGIEEIAVQVAQSKNAFEVTEDAINGFAKALKSVTELDFEKTIADIDRVTEGRRKSLERAQDFGGLAALEEQSVQTTIAAERKRLDESVNIARLRADLLLSEVEQRGAREGLSEQVISDKKRAIAEASLQERIGLEQQFIAAVQGQISQLDSSVSSIEGRIQTLEDQRVAFRRRVTDQLNAIDESRLTQAEIIARRQTQVDSIEQARRVALELTTTSARIAALERLRDKGLELSQALTGVDNNRAREAARQAQVTEDTLVNIQRNGLERQKAVAEELTAQLQEQVAKSQSLILELSQAEIKLNLTVDSARLTKSIQSAVDSVGEVVIPLRGVLGQELLDSISRVISSSIQKVGGFATGTNAPIMGPGTKTSDSILARLSRGEFVIRADAVSRYGSDFFAALNNMSLPRFAQGGFVSIPQLVAPSVSGGNRDVVDINLNVQGQPVSLFGNRDQAEKLADALQTLRTNIVGG